MVRRIGAWSTRAGMYDPEPWAEVASKLGLTDVSVCGNAQSFLGEFDPFVSAAECAKALAVYADAGITAHLMLWPVPSTIYMSGLGEYVREVHRLFPRLASVDLDAEEQWTRHQRREAIGGKVAQSLRAAWPHGLPLAVNGITAALPNLLDLVAIADVLWPQAYTTTRPGQTAQPGKRQHEVFKAWKQRARMGAVVNMGLAAYSQEGAGGHDATTALRLAFDAAAEHVGEVRYWSLQELSGGTDAAFVRARCTEIRGARHSA